MFVALSVLFFHLATNTISEYRDFRNGIDDVHSLDTKYRLVSGIVRPNVVLRTGVIAFLLASISGVTAVLIGTNLLLIPGIIAAGISVFYSERPFCLKYKALGELCVFMAYGPLLFSSCFLALRGIFSVSDILFSFPFGLLTSCVLLANNIRDYEFEMGKTKTLVTKWGLSRAYTLLFCMLHLSFLCIPFFIYAKMLKTESFIVFCAYPIIFSLVRKINSSRFIVVFGGLLVLFYALTFISLLFGNSGITPAWNSVCCISRIVPKYF
ncbi:MAG: prenyltransferase [Holosporales bacterium]|nr:prenyltransferase [Holosporales bacterium]